MKELKFDLNHAKETVIIDGCTVRIHYVSDEESIQMETIQKVLLETLKAS
jgi:hypothetical protein